MPSYRPIESSDEHDEAERTRPSTDEARLLPPTVAPPSSREPPAAGRTPSSRYVQIPLSEVDDEEEEEGDDDNEERPHNGRPETSSLPSYSVSHDRDRGQQQQQQQQIRSSSPATLHVSAAEGTGSTASSSSSGPSTPRRPADRRAPLSPLPQPRDGVFANLSAKPASHATEEHKEEDDEVPPPYETAAADPTPSYFDTTVITAGTMDDEILVEGLPVGSGFVFVWNMLVSMSFQFVGFLLTYLLHTSHAGKNGSRAGLGITLIQYGFYLRSRTAQDDMYGYYSSGQGNMSEKSQEEVSSRAELLSYVVMVLGWFITIRSTSEYIRARKLQAVITYHPENVIV